MLTSRKSGRFVNAETIADAKATPAEASTEAREIVVVVINQIVINIIQNLTYRETEPGRLFRNYRFSVNHNTEWNYGLVHRWSRLNPQVNVTFNNFWSASAAHGD